MTVIVHLPTEKFYDPTMLIPVGTLYSTGQQATYRHQLHDDPATHSRRRGAHVPGGGLRVYPRAWGGGHDSVYCILYINDSVSVMQERVTSVELASTDGKLSYTPMARLGWQWVSKVSRAPLLVSYVERALVSITVSPDMGKGGRETRCRLSMVHHAKLGCRVRELIHTVVDPGVRCNFTPLSLIW